MENLSEYCAPGTEIKEEMIAVSEIVSLRVITFMPNKKNDNPAVLFVAGWISLIKGWKFVLKEMTRDFPVFYVETREKISSRVIGKAGYGVEEIGQDILALVSRLNLNNRKYILFGSSLGATAILDCCQSLTSKPLSLILIGPNAAFRVPKLGMAAIRILPPRLYLVFKPFIKWYLKTFRLNVRSDYAQYEKYCNALDAADPWKLKKGALSLSKYQVWELLEEIECPTLIVGASKDALHEPKDLQKMVSKMKNARYLDLETNKETHSEVMVEEMRKFIVDLSGKKG